MNSFNHYSYGAVSAWMFGRMGGIEPDERQPGFKHVILQPTPDFRTEFPDGQERITHVQASHRSGYGLIRSEWQYKTDGRISYTAEKGKGSDIQGHEGRESRYRVAIGHLQVRYGGWQNRFRRYDEDG